MAAKSRRIDVGQALTVANPSRTMVKLTDVSEAFIYVQPSALF